MKINELKEFLDEKVLTFNSPDFIADDPVQIPHLFTEKEDIEIAGFLAATIAWGNRKMIINNAHKMMLLMGNSPYDFVLHHTPEQLEKLDGFVHRTFNATDFKQFIRSLHHIYTQHEGLENVFYNQGNYNLQQNISHFKRVFFEIEHEVRTEKHISDPLKGSAAKRINMYLRWMVRNDNHGVDLGIWKQITPAQLSCPLDVHSGNIARKLNILKRKQNDAKALLELDTFLRKLDPVDPVKYDFALFGLGAIEKF
ncbi:TIGR02757 family protein [Flavobacterium agricola]|uniref:TIGR02757 family protein n=1 Tax=Flavobacterium agricola TaxID=2870839 RepID=A0ABY6M208_9FLAO|nr:TIGR02757 family protein [Flavobacterium agricola]UYW02549.1 TIGR02757 family protein [Flavobacterium agricola]